jgi:putative PIN family toxin of toxin-antitoxin system
MQLILDTNVVIDWLVFNDPYMVPFRERVVSGDVIVLTHELALAEFERVLGYPELKLATDRRAGALARYRAHSRVTTMPEGFALGAWKLPAGFPSCRDRDDDLFLSLTHHSQASALVTRDKALLKMRKRMRKRGMTIWDVPQLMAQIRHPDVNRDLREIPASAGMTAEAVSGMNPRLP